MNNIISRSIRLSLVAAFFMLSASSPAKAQISLPTASPYTQSFDSLSTSATATLPADWRVDKIDGLVRTVGSFTTAGTVTEQIAGNGMAVNAANGIYNYGAGVANTATDRAAGWISSGTATRSGNLYARFINSTGASVSSLSISYDIEKYRNGSNTAGFRIEMFYSFDGATWTAAPANFLTSFPADANNNGFASAPGVIVSLTNQVLQVTIPNGSDFYLAWNYCVTSGTTTTNAQALGIDNFSVIVNTVTAVELLSFTASQSGDGVLLEWATGHEVDNLGFNIYREDGGKRARITPRIVAGSALLAGSGNALTAGRQYRWFDPAPGIEGNIDYWLEDIDLNGKVTLHGPITPAPGGKLSLRSDSLPLSSVQTDTRAWQRQVVVSNVGKNSHPHSAQESLNSLQTQWEIAAGPAVKITIKKDGWYRVTQPALVAAGLDPSRDPRLLRLFADAEEVPIIVRGGQKGRLEPTDVIEFYGATLDTPSTDRRVYWLTSGNQPGRRITILAGEAVKPTGGGSFPYTVERKERSVYFAALINGEAENFFGPVVTADPVAQEFRIENLDKGSTDKARLEVALQGVTDVTNVAPDHSVKVKLNGVEIGSVAFDGQARKITEIIFSNQLLLEGSNDITLVAEGGEMDVSLIDHIRLTYAHRFRADGDALELSAIGGEPITVTGFSQPAIRVFDITDPNDVQEMTPIVEAQGSEFAITFRANASGERRLLALVDHLAQAPFTVTANRPSTLNRAGNGANFIIITHGLFAAAMEPLKRLRQGQGLSATIVDVEDVYDEFSHGAHSPQAVKDFLARAATVWKKRPGWVMFAGDASFDPRDYLNLGESDFVPTKLIDTSGLETASDDWLADFDSDGLPEMAVGRLPVRTVGEAGAVIEKIMGYAQAGRAEGALMVADRNDGYDFEAASLSVKARLPADVIAQEVFRGRVDDATARQQIIDAARRGPKIVNYLGHGSAGTWRGDLLTSSDAAALQNSEGPSLFVMMTCLNGFFHDPYGDSLAESLMKCERGGAVAAWASSSLTTPGGQSAMNQRFYQLLFAGNLTLGEAAMRAKLAASDTDIRRTWILFGDPTLKIK
ncbi:MAG TPA: C25 family cysteine peptidase [Blastocatellia bacterium]|nr:C25 family cysteine peptidase [Blastocatellia bacterium]